MADKPSSDREKTHQSSRKLPGVHMDGFGPAYGKLYLNETSKIEQITADWTTTPDHGAAVTLLNLENRRQELGTADIAFDKRYIYR